MYLKCSKSDSEKQDMKCRKSLSPNKTLSSNSIGYSETWVDFLLPVENIGGKIILLDILHVLIFKGI